VNYKDRDIRVAILPKCANRNDDRWIQL